MFLSLLLWKYPEVPVLVKICLLGDGAVGKTSLKNQFLGSGFNPKYLITIGADFAIRDIKLSNGQEYKLQIWDLAGQPRFNAVRTLYYKGSMGSVLIFDITNRSSLDNLQGWLKEYWRHSGETSIPMVILGNKKDLREEYSSAVTTAEGQKFTDAVSARAINKKFHYFETSAKTGENVEEAFTVLTSQIHEHLKTSGGFFDQYAIKRD